VGLWKLIANGQHVCVCRSDDGTERDPYILYIYIILTVTVVKIYILVHYRISKYCIDIITSRHHWHRAVSFASACARNAACIYIIQYNINLALASPAGNLIGIAVDHGNAGL